METSEIWSAGQEGVTEWFDGSDNDVLKDTEAKFALKVSSKDDLGRYEPNILFKRPEPVC